MLENVQRLIFPVSFLEQHSEGVCSSKPCVMNSVFPSEKTVIQLGGYFASQQTVASTLTKLGIFTRALLSVF